MLLVVSEGLRARSLLVLRDGHLHAAQPMLRRHQETRMSASRRRQTIHGAVLQGLTFATAFHTGFVIDR